MVEVFFMYSYKGDTIKEPLVRKMLASTVGREVNNYQQLREKES